MSRRDGPEAAAHRYADAGWRVFPARVDGKEPLFPTAHPKADPQAGQCHGECGEEGHGCHDAVTDHDQISRWWSRTPDANVAIATGSPGPDVVDVDNHGERGNGFKGWNEARRAGLVKDPKAIIETPSGGLHAYFAGSEQGNGKAVKAHIDFRGRGGYVVAPGSTVGGKPYVVVQHQAGPGAPVDWQAIRQLVDPQPERKAFTPQPGKPVSMEHLARHVANLQEGNRNDGTFWALCRAAEVGDRDAMAAIAESARSIGLTEQEISASVRSAERTAVPVPERRPFARAPEIEMEAG